MSEARLSDILDAALGGDRRKLDRFLKLLTDENMAQAIGAAHGAARRRDPAREFCAGVERRDRRLRAARDWLSDGYQDGERADRAHWQIGRGSARQRFSLRTLADDKDGEPGTSRPRNWRTRARIYSNI